MEEMAELLAVQGLLEDWQTTEMTFEAAPLCVPRVSGMLHDLPRMSDKLLSVPAFELQAPW